MSAGRSRCPALRCTVARIYKCIRACLHTEFYTCVDIYIYVYTWELLHSKLENFRHVDVGAFAAAWTRHVRHELTKQTLQYGYIHIYIYVHLFLIYTYTQNVIIIAHTICIGARTHTHTYVRIYVRTYVRMYVCMYVCVGICIFISISIFMPIYVHICICMHFYIHVFTYIYMYMCVVCRYLTSCQAAFLMRPRSTPSLQAWGLLPS